jgi:hypothetical protein
MAGDPHFSEAGEIGLIEEGAGGTGTRPIRLTGSTAPLFGNVI